MRNNYRPYELQRVKKAAIIINKRDLYRLTENAGPRNSSASKVIKESDGSLIHSQMCQLER